MTVRRRFLYFAPRALIGFRPAIDLNDMAAYAGPPLGLYRIEPTTERGWTWDVAHGRWIENSDVFDDWHDRYIEDAHRIAAGDVAETREQLHVRAELTERLDSGVDSD